MTARVAPDAGVGRVGARWAAALRAGAVSLLLLASAGQPLVAQERLAIVLGNDHGIAARDAQSDADTRAVASALFRAGFDVLNGYNPSPDDVPRGGASLTSLVIFYSGPVMASGDDLFLPSDGWTPPVAQSGADGSELSAAPPEASGTLTQDADPAPIPGWTLSGLVADPFGMAADEVIILIETCHGPDQSIAAPDLPQTDAGVFVAFAASTLDCAAALNAGVRLTDFVVRAAATTGEDVAQVLQAEPDILTLGQPMAPLVFLPGDPSRPPSAPAAGAARPATVTARTAETATLRAVATQAIPTAATGPGVSSGFGGGATQPAVLRGDGFPRPSIIVGLIRPDPEPLSDLPEDDGPADTEDQTPDDVVAVPLDEDGGDLVGTAQGGEDVPAVAFDPGDRAAREVLRANSPDLFALYLDQGSFDPPDGDFATALQIELRDMNCYRFGIDGDWGPGSRSAIRSYYAELNRAGVASAGEAATQEVFRVVLANGPVRCPDPVVQPRATPTPPTPTVRTPAPVAPAPSTPEPVAPARPINPRDLIIR